MHDRWPKCGLRDGRAFRQGGIGGRFPERVDLVQWQMIVQIRAVHAVTIQIH
jgi:hypothetical protein